MTEGFMALLVGALVLYFLLWLYILLPARMAKARGRGAFGWVLLSLIFSPILAILLLWLIGDHPRRFIHGDSN